MSNQSSLSSEKPLSASHLYSESSTNKNLQTNLEEENQISSVTSLTTQDELSSKNENEPTSLIVINGKQFSLLAVLEALLFVSDGPVEVAHLTKVTEQPGETICDALQALRETYVEQNSGLRIQEYNGRFQLVTQPLFAPLIEEYLSIDLTTKLSAPALETLAIIAYRQPLTRAQIEAVRGVDCSGMLRSLMQRGLIEESGRLEGVGRPILYNVTKEFMHHFGLTGLDELPALGTTEADTLWAATKLAEMEAADE